MKNSLTFLGIILLCLASGLLHAQNQEKTNFVFILADDFGWKDLHCTGSEFYESPNIDRLAKMGVIFENGYAASQVCSPARASILTGKYTARHGVTNWIGEASGENWRNVGRHTKLLPPSYKMQLPAEEITLAETLRSNGYKTFFAGKWHLGEKGSYPEDHGFDINKGGYEAGAPYGGGYFSPYNNPKLTDGKMGENLSMRLAKETVSFIETQTATKKNQPFFAFLSFYAVHAPLETTQENWQHFRNKADSIGIADHGFEMGKTFPIRTHQDNPVYAGLIKQMDDAVGVLLDELEELGLMKNTVVVFTGDNGGVCSGDDYSSSNLPLRGGKGMQWEGGFRVPVIICAPGYKSGTITKIPAIGTDFYPTFLDMANIPFMPRQHADGRSLLPALKGQDMADRYFYWHYPHYGNQGGEPSSVVQYGKWKLIHYYEDDRNELYNLEIDPTESETLNAQYPDKVKELSENLNIWLVSVQAKYPQPDMKYDPLKETQFKAQVKKVLLPQLEAKRIQELNKNYVPNKDWWGSTTVD